jgi:hypothetical protein
MINSQERFNYQWAITNNQLSLETPTTMANTQIVTIK